MKLLTRDQFREGVFKRDNHQCVICGAKGEDAHHIIERRLFVDGGYYLVNGSTLCAKHHMQAEETTLSCEEIRAACKIDEVLLPQHFFPNLTYDKWGNVVLHNNQRLRGELFDEEPVQKILKQAGLLHIFLPYVIHPKVYQVPFSKSEEDEDIFLENLNNFDNQQVILLEDYSGEFFSWYQDCAHGQFPQSLPTLDYGDLGELWNSIALEIPDGWRLCGKHHQDEFILYTIWDEYNTCLSWKETVAYAGMLGLNTLKVIGEVIFGEGAFPEKTQAYPRWMMRRTDEFAYRDYRKSVAAYKQPRP